MLHKKNKKLFGNGIEPKCEYCANSCGAGEKFHCSAGLGTGHAEPCPKFRYDPLRRTPTDTPEIQKQSPEDFKL